MSKLNMLKVDKSRLVDSSFENFRDISFIPNKLLKNFQIKDSIIFRSASLSRYNPEIVLDFLKEHKINYILDLRGIKELELYRSSNNFYENGIKDNYVISIPMEPFVPTYITTDPALNFYYAAIKGFQEEIREIFTTYFNNAINKSVIIHCEYGKDRTGIVIALLFDLLGIDREIIIEDYLASKMDTNREYIQLIFDVIDKEFGGINNYLLQYCKISPEVVKSIQQSLITI